MRGELPQGPLGVPGILKDEAQPQPPLVLSVLVAHCQRRGHEVFATFRGHPYPHGDPVVAAVAEPRVAFLPGAVQVDRFRSPRGFVECHFGAWPTAV